MNKINMLSNKILIILTTILSVLILTAVFLNSCDIPDYNDPVKTKSYENSTYGYYYIDAIRKYRKLQIDDHEYILFTSTRGNICVIHSESCPCKKK